MLFVKYVSSTAAGVQLLQLLHLHCSPFCGTALANRCLPAVLYYVFSDHFNHLYTFTILFLCLLRVVQEFLCRHYGYRRFKLKSFWRTGAGLYERPTTQPLPRHHPSLYAYKCVCACVYRSSIAAVHAVDELTAVTVVPIFNHVLHTRT